MKPVLAALILSILALPALMPVGDAQAQGAAVGARRGAAEGERVGGPVGAALGGAVGGMVGGAAGVLGEDPGPRGYRTGLPTRAGYKPAMKRHHARHPMHRLMRKR